MSALAFENFSFSDQVQFPSNHCRRGQDVSMDDVLSPCSLRPNLSVPSQDNLTTPESQTRNTSIADLSHRFHRQNIRSPPSSSVHHSTYQSSYKSAPWHSSRTSSPLGYKDIDLQCNRFYRCQTPTRHLYTQAQKQRFSALMEDLLQNNESHPTALMTISHPSKGDPSSCSSSFNHIPHVTLSPPTPFLSSQAPRSAPTSAYLTPESSRTRSVVSIEEESENEDEDETLPSEIIDDDDDNDDDDHEDARRLLFDVDSIRWNRPSYLSLNRAMAGPTNTRGRIYSNHCVKKNTRWRSRRTRPTSRLVVRA
ncbi:hypothetical protein MMC09_004814 [Bachmanniomyces sp. S44760]|nr:hypothetical protein [Bachmanniomyces sp. S44760]